MGKPLLSIKEHSTIKSNKFFMIPTTSPFHQLFEEKPLFNMSLTDKTISTKEFDKLIAVHH